jgi:hypothetical protein
MKKYDRIVGIDPDVDKSGVAELKTDNRYLNVASLIFPQLIDYLIDLKSFVKERDESVIVVVEAGWLNTISNYHTAAGRRGQRIAKNVGANHQVGKIIVEMCERHDIPVEIVKPLKKMWKGKNGKITHEELAAFTGLFGMTNQEGRDAALIAWTYAGLPIKLKN